MITDKKKIDFAKLLGFQMISDELAERVDFQSETFAGRLGAKVGDKTCTLFDLPRKARSGRT